VEFACIIISSEETLFELSLPLIVDPIAAKV